MKVAYSCEIIGRRFGAREKGSRPWVALVTGRANRANYHREFLPVKIDYSGSNKRGTRGIMAWWTLDTGALYQACTYAEWDTLLRHWIAVDGDGTIRELTDEQAQEVIDQMDRDDSDGVCPTCGREGWRR